MFLPFRPDLKIIARENRKNPTKAELIMWYKVLNNYKMSYRFLRQKPINNFIVDFYCSKLRLIIEIDGDSHTEQTDYDQQRTQILSQYKLKVIRYKNSDILGKLDGVYSDLCKQIENRKIELNL